jgi:hypothetical protein
MPQEPTNSQSRLNRTDAQGNQEAKASRVHHWEPGLKPGSMRGYSLSVGQRHTRAMLPTRDRRSLNHELSFPAWHKPYAEALLESDPEIVVKLLAATEKAVFERLLELARDKDANCERRDIRCAIDVMLTLGTRDRVTSLGESYETFCKGSGTTTKVVIPLPEPPNRNSKLS